MHRIVASAVLTCFLCAFGAPRAVYASGYRVLYSFGGTIDAFGPLSGPTLDSQGNLLGTTSGGGPGDGTLYRLSPSGDATLLATFPVRAFPEASPTLDAAGDIYVPTYQGTGPVESFIFILSPSGKSTRIPLFTIDTQSPIIFDHSGNLVDSTIAASTASPRKPGSPRNCTISPMARQPTATTSCRGASPSMRPTMSTAAPLRAARTTWAPSSGCPQRGRKPSYTAFPIRMAAPPRTAA